MPKRSSSKVRAKVKGWGQGHESMLKVRINCIHISSVLNKHLSS